MLSGLVSLTPRAPPPPGVTALYGIACCESLTPILLAGLRIKHLFKFGPMDLAACTLPSQAGSAPGEIVHRCRPRRVLYEELASLLPSLMHSERNCWFRVTNSPPPPPPPDPREQQQQQQQRQQQRQQPGSCLFDGARLELNLSFEDAPEFGFCFRRACFAAERDRFSLEAAAAATHPCDTAQWVRREPTDPERLQVNKRGRELLYLIRPPSAEMDMTCSDLRAEVRNTLQLAHHQRFSLAAGPFHWPSSFQDDGSGIYITYFKKDIVVDGRHMKTLGGAALIDVIEEKVVN